MELAGKNNNNIDKKPTPKELAMDKVNKEWLESQMKLYADMNELIKCTYITNEPNYNKNTPYTLASRIKKWFLDNP